MTEKSALQVMSGNRLDKIIATISFLAICIMSCAPPEKAPPLVDGDINEYAALGVTPIQLADSVDLYLYQDDYYVWIGFDYPTGSYGTMDMKLKTEATPEMLNLHVSGQIGEWVASQPETAPANPESEMWWNNRGWIANPVWINGMDTTGPNPRYRFKNASARELQLSKDRFGRGKWELLLDIRAIRQKDGSFGSLRFPKDSGVFEFDVK